LTDPRAFPGTRVYVNRDLEVEVLLCHVVKGASSDLHRICRKNMCGDAHLVHHICELAEELCAELEGLDSPGKPA
jgi:hypothetical protein